MFNILKYGIIAGIIFSANYINVRQDCVIAYAKVIESNDTISLKTTLSIDEWENAVYRYVTDSIANELKNDTVNCKY